MTFLDDPAVKTAILTGLIQIVAVAIGFILYFIYSKITKKDLMYHKKEITAGMIKDKEITIEKLWILFREAEDQKKEIEDKVRANLAAIDEEKKKTPMNMEKIKSLAVENDSLGFSCKYQKDGKPEWRSSSKVINADNKVANYQAEITKAAMEREYLKVDYQAICRLIKKGYVKDFKKFEKENLYKRIVLPK